MSVAEAELIAPVKKRKVIYPESDGEPMAENTVQFLFILIIVGNLDILYMDNPDVFVAGDLFWYPVEDNRFTRTAPDAMVVFGRPKGHRGSYLQWQEGNIPPQVVFEILSPGNRLAEMDQKFAFYETYGVEEYYIYDPDRGRLQGWQRQRGKLRPIQTMSGWVSPRLGIRFEMVGMELELYYPDGRRFLSMIELEQARQAAETRAEAEAEARQAAEARVRELEDKLRQAGLLDS